MGNFAFMIFCHQTKPRQSEVRFPSGRSGFSCLGCRFSFLNFIITIDSTLVRFSLKSLMDPGPNSESDVQKQTEYPCASTNP